MSQRHLDQVKTEAGRVVARLKSLGLPIKSTQAYEALAAIHNFSDWNKFHGHLLKAPDVESKAAPEFGVESTILRIPPGHGGGAVLRKLIDAQCAMGVPKPVFILRAYESTNGLDPVSVAMQFFGSKRERVNLFIATCSDQGVTLQPSRIDARNKATAIVFLPNESPKISRALVNLVLDLDFILGGMGGVPRTVVIDRIGEFSEHPEELGNAIATHPKNDFILWDYDQCGVSQKILQHSRRPWRELVITDYRRIERNPSAQQELINRHSYAMRERFVDPAFLLEDLVAYVTAKLNRERVEEPDTDLARRIGAQNLE